MLKHFLVAILCALPVYGYGQRYADSPFYKPSAPAPATANMGWSPHGAIQANNVVIDLYESVSTSAPGFDGIAGWTAAQRVDGTKPAQILHFFIEFPNLNIVFAYDVLAEPVEDTNKIECTFSAPTDTTSYGWAQKGITPVALSSDLVPITITSGDTISVTMLPLGQDKVPVIEYLQFTRTEPSPVAAQ